MMLRSTRKLLARVFTPYACRLHFAAAAATGVRAPFSTTAKPAPTQQEKSKDEEEQLPYLELIRDFLDPKDFYDVLNKSGISFYTGVPDSLLKDFCAYVSDNHPKDQHVIAANEGSALSLATGYYLATSKVPLVYLQNSGLGNIVNPLMSLAHQKVFGIPMIILIGWRGEPGKKDEPQHMLQGKTMNGLITEMGIPFEVLPDFLDGAKEVVENAVYNAVKRKSPFALIVKRQTFTKYVLKNKVKVNTSLNREQALNVMVPLFGDHDAVVGTTGFLSRELYELRELRSEKHDQDFYCVGSMGHASSIAAGVALMKRSRKVWCLDGDGAAIMHLGAMTQVGQLGLKNFKHVIFNNQSHDSVGAQPTAGNVIDFAKIALGCGYKEAWKVSTDKEIVEVINKARDIEGPVLIEVQIKPGARKDLGRPRQTPQENKDGFINFLSM